MDASGGPFRIRSLERLRASETIEQAWTSVNNDEFFELALCVQAVTGVALEGYGRPEAPDAPARLQRTLDELEAVVQALNAMPSVRDASWRFTPATRRVQPIVDELIEDLQRAVGSQLSPQLLGRIEGQISVWATRLTEADALSELIVYVPTETTATTEASGVDPVATTETPAAPDAVANLRPGARELVEIAGRLASSRAVSEIEPIDIVVAAMVRPRYSELDRAELRRGATFPLSALIDETSTRLSDALSVLGSDVADVDGSLGSSLTTDLAESYLRPGGRVDAAVAVARDVGADAVYSHHVVANALGRELPSDVLAALGVTGEQLRLALRRGIADRWSEREDAVTWDRLLGRSVHPDDYSASVRKVRDELGPDSLVTAAQIVIALQRDHPGYVSGRFEKVEIQTARGGVRPVDAWLVDARNRYDIDQLSSTRHQVVDGELAIAALAEIDPSLHSDLAVDGFLLALVEQLEIVPVPTVAEPVGPLLAGANADTVPEPGNGRVRAADRLDTAAEVEMLVSVILARDTPLPLAIALFGGWGSGKSFFMALMQERMDELSRLAAAGRPEAAPYCRSVRAVRFNAWHYVDTNLWASLAATLFDQLAQADRPGETVEKLSELDAATAKLEKVAKKRAFAETEVEAARAAVPTTTESAASAIDAVRNDDDLRSKLERAKFAPTDDPRADDLVAALGALHGFAASARATWKLARAELSHRRRAATVVTLLVLVAVAAGAWVVTNWGAAGRVASMCVVLIGALTPAIDGARRTLKLASEARRAREQRVREKERRLTELERNEARRQREVDRVQSELDALRNKGDRMREFVRSRAASPDYRSRLGLVSQLRHDFEQLTELLPAPDAAGAQEVVAAAAAVARELPEVERIVLYIDDLDRCPQPKVVEVLQAVHLLLAFKLFVVVVGVDNKWLERSLEKHYADLLDEPDDYLEKIFQISFALRGMTPTQFGALIDTLAAPRHSSPAVGHRESEEDVKEESAASPDPGSLDADHLVTVGERPEGGAPDDSQDDSPDAAAADPAIDGEPAIDVDPEPVLPKPEALSITTEERALLGELSGIVSTPRSVKRLMNIYRMLRVSIPDDEYAGFQPAQGDEYQALVVLVGLLVGRPDIATTLFPRILTAAPEHDIWNVIESDKAARFLLEPLRSSIRVTRCEPYGRWVPRVARFSIRLAATIPDPEVRTSERRVQS